jgi:cell division protein FtsZ
MLDNLSIRFAEDFASNARIKVVGVGGAGGNAINGMIHAGLVGVEFIAVNTDLQALEINKASCRVQIGKTLTKGLGAGANPEVGRRAIEENMDDIGEVLRDTDMVFVTAGMGGGTGTGAAPVIAEIARNLGTLTVGIVTKPFQFEGKKRMERAEEGIEELKEKVDTLIVIPNQRLLAIVERHTTLVDAFLMADDILLQATRGISDLITVPGMINLDFADVRTVMSEMGDALMGVGVAKGENRALEAAQQAISSPLLEDVNIAGAKGVLVNITGGSDVTLYDVNDATTVIYEAAGGEANIIFGAVINPELTDELRVTVIATGFCNPNSSTRKETETVAVKKMETPTYWRRNRMAESNESMVLRDNFVPPNKENMEIPTFLRRQMD